MKARLANGRWSCFADEAEGGPGGRVGLEGVGAVGEALQHGFAQRSGLAFLWGLPEVGDGTRGDCAGMSVKDGPVGMKDGAGARLEE